ncbi:RfaG Glycosyltransferase [Candidatus Methylopumilus universalis]|uniref:glycosyltransferase n=1 Tax=Candidatus Methylopumilus universalis TaxID=2588536 RepID=UPI003BEF35F8
MRAIKVHIIFDFREGPWGGCNQFLKALRDELKDKGQWASKVHDADVIIFDSINNFFDVLFWKFRLPNVLFVQRIDGPISLYRGNGLISDQLVYKLGEYLADGVIFQSKFSREANLSLGMTMPKNWIVIRNASHKNIFRPKKSQIKKREYPLKIISTSWSSNPRKGFDVYKYLDDNLDFNLFTMTFVGNSNIVFKNIRHIPPLTSSKLAEELRNNDIFLTASKDDPCSNALTEAMACGLPAIARKSGGHPEIVGNAGVFFENQHDVLDAIKKLSENFLFYKSRVRAQSIEIVTSEYANFFKKLFQIEISPKNLTYGKIVYLLFIVVKYKVAIRLIRIATYFKNVKFLFNY